MLRIARKTGALQSELRQLRAQIQYGGLFPRAQTVTLPAQMQRVGILALGTRRQYATEPAVPVAPLIPAKPRAFVHPVIADACAIAVTVSAPSQENLEHRTDGTEHVDENMTHATMTASDDNDIAFDFESPRAARAESDQDAPF